MIHPAIQAVLNMQQEMNGRLSRMGHTAVQELLLPLWDSNVPIVAISWDQGMDVDAGSFFSTHQVPRLLVEKEHTKVAYLHPQKIVGVLGSGWVMPKELIPATRQVFEEKIDAFCNIPNEVMKLIFGENVTINILRTGRISQGPM